MLSRVADSLYWMARYIERAENNARIVDVNLQLTLDSENAGSDGERLDWLPIIATLEDQNLFSKTYPIINGDTVCAFVTFAPENPNSIRSCVGIARENARTVREYISSEMWERINSLYLWINSADARQLYTSSAIDFYRMVVDYSHQFQGTTSSTLQHNDGWHFLQVGKFIERADSTSRILDLKYHVLLPRGETVGGNVDTLQWIALLKTCSAFEAYRKNHTGTVTPASVAQFIVLNDSFPRSIRFCVDGLDDAMHRISGCSRTHFTNEAERLAGKLCADLNYTDIGAIFRTGLHEYLDSIQLRLLEIGGAMHKQYCEWQEEPAPSQSQSQSQG